MTVRQPPKPALPRDTAFPRHYLRIGVLEVATPAPAGSPRPEPMPYQWTCHVESASGLTEQFGFLDTRGLDPRPELVEALLAVIARTGAILVPSARETALLHGLHRHLADPPGALADALTRLVEVDRFAQRRAKTEIGRALSVDDPASSVLWPDDAVDTSHELRDDPSARAAYLELIDVRTQAARRRQLIRALVRYGDRQLSDLVQAFAEHAGGAPDPVASGQMLN